MSHMSKRLEMPRPPCLLWKVRRLRRLTSCCRMCSAKSGKRLSRISMISESSRQTERSNARMASRVSSGRWTRMRKLALARMTERRMASLSCFGMMFNLGNDSLMMSEMAATSFFFTADPSPMKPPTTLMQPVEGITQTEGDFGWGGGDEEDEDDAELLAGDDDEGAGRGRRSSAGLLLLQEPSADSAASWVLGHGVFSKALTSSDEKGVER